MVNDRPGAPGNPRSADPSEGVRIIGAEEAAEAMERGDVAARRGGNEPRYGDRPQRPPVGPRPVLRFPLAPSADPTMIEKPPVRAPDGGPGEQEEENGASIPGRGRRFDPQPDPSEQLLPEAAAPEGGSGATPEGRPPFSDDPTLDQTLDEPLGPPFDDEAEGSTATPATDESIALPHWSEPATGEVPRVIAGEDTDDLDAWSSFTSSSPRWRDSERDYEDDNLQESLTEGAEWRVGAMDDSRPTHEQIYSFDELDQDSAPVAGTGRRASIDLGPDSPGVGAEEPAKPAVVKTRRRPPRPPRQASGTGDDAGNGPSTTSGDGGGGRSVPTAVLVGVALAAVALVLFKLGPRYAMVLVVAVLVVSAVEYFNAVRRAGYQPAVLLGLGATATFPLAVYWKGIEAYPLVGVVVVMAGLLWHLVGADGNARVIESVGVTLLGVAWIGGLGSFAALMLTLPDGVGVLLAAVIATVAYDVGGFFIGRSTGTRPLSEASPNKTWEGLAGGMVAAVMATWVIVSTAPGIHPFDSWGAAVTVGIAAALAAPLGDLCESLVKRDLGIKDMGSILPGHGGILDRFDAMLFVLPVVFYAALYFELGPFGS